MVAPRARRMRWRDRFPRVAMETGGGPLPGATRVEVDAEVGAEGIDRRESAAVGAELSGRGGWRGGNSAGPASVVARLSPGTGRRSKDVEVNQPGDVRQRLRWISSGGGHPIFFLVVITRLRLPLVVGNTWGEATPTSRLESSHRRVPIDHRTTSTHRGVTLGSLRRAAPLLVGVDPPPPVVSATSAGDRRGAMAVGSGARAVGDGGGGGVGGGGLPLVARHRVVTAAASPTGLLSTRRLGCQ
ncbi:hypothetical protein EE612_015936 [Oryza sativa]|nr:hypothetical protein EE612_015936 [Oryza sativa]